MHSTSTPHSQPRSVSIITSLERAAHFLFPRRHKTRRPNSPTLTESPHHPISQPTHRARTVSNLLSICRELNPDGLGVRATASLVHPSTLSPFLQLEHCGPKRMSSHASPGIDTPRCGQQCLTYVIRGQLHHRDSYGNSCLLRTGSASLLTAGSGLVVSHTLHGPIIEYISVWINIPRHLKAATPHHSTTTNPPCTIIGQADAAAQIRVLAAPQRNSAMNQLHSQVTPCKSPHDSPHSASHLQTHAGGAAVYDVRMHPKSQLVLNPETQRAYVYIYRGSATIDQSTVVEQGQFAVLSEDVHLPIVIRSAGVHVNTPPSSEYDWYDFDTFVPNSCWCIVLAGNPIPEPVTMLSSGIVASTPQEIRKAFQEYTCGSFGSCSPSTIHRVKTQSVLDYRHDSSTEEQSDADHSDAEHDSDLPLGKLDA
ncbi:hypothetical protein BWQ96_05541 [Gracilariopsis chorda]|uniref:Pirin N-terminal domain-containing protein n=1 Tax=Gracilariopsis chorda TaxID=448386 RepID=A0A2V3IRF7_9FLOR|nr:hypothetical protein BWQ96_05541 [Gracilariopsis chorda]|eukprot:PXF44684.1 hypothetical protein BWQ96_05541 [Gracilariopsis chorda]